MIAHCWASLIRLGLSLVVFLVLASIWRVFRLYPIPLLFLLAAWRWRNYRRGGGSSWSHGSARFGGWATLAKGSMLSDTGLICGDAGLMERPERLAATLGLFSPFRRPEPACRAFLAAFLGEKWQADRFIRLKKFQNVAIFAKTGSGKGVSIIVPNLLSLAQSVVVSDIKGELWRLTGLHRKRRLRQTVLRLDPDGIAGPVSESATLNPLDFIDENSDAFLDDCRELARQMVPRTANEGESAHWLDSATLVISAFVAFVCGCEADRSKRNLNTVRAFVASRTAFANAVHVMQLQTDACQGVIARLGGMLTWYVDRELGSVLATCQRFTEFLDSPAVQRNVASSSFDPRILRSGRASLYLCLAHNKVESLAPLQRLWFATILRVLATDGTGEKAPVLFVVDEAAHLGRLEIVERAITLYRGMGIKFLLVYQSINQVKEVFGDKAETVLDNLGTKQFFAVGSHASAQAISDMIGETTIQIASTNKTTSWSRPSGGSGPGGNQPGSYSTSTAITTSDTARRLLRPEEIMTLDEDTSLLFHGNASVVPTRLIRYYDHPAFRRGGTGKPRRLGLSAGLAAASLLVLSTGLLSMALALPRPDQLRQMAAQPNPYPARSVQPVGVRWQQPSRRNTRPHGGGFQWTPDR